MSSPVKYKPQDYFPAIIEQLMEGTSLTEICSPKSMPGKSLFLKWIKNDKSMRDQYTCAREIGQATNFDGLRTIAKDCDDDKISVNKARLMIDTEKWILSKQNPKKYGDKLAVDQHNTGPAVFNIVDASTLKKKTKPK